LREDARQAAAVALAARTTLPDIAATLARAGVDWMLWKGPALAVQAWGDANARHLSDLDFVVRPRDRRRAAEALRAAGWRPRHGMTARQQEAIEAGSAAFAFERAPTEPLLELHWRFAARRFPVPFSIDHVFARSESVAVSATTVRTPAHAEALTLLALHGTKHGWSVGEEVATFARLEERRPEAAQALRSRAAAEIPRSLTLAFALVDLLTGAESLPDASRIEAMLRATRGPVLAQMISSCVERMCAGQGGWRPDHRWSTSWIEGPLPQARYFAHSLLSPTLEEWKWVRLPSALAWLYPIVRLLRLAIRG
jgi:hypothetical protein